MKAGTLSRVQVEENKLVVLLCASIMCSTENLQSINVFVLCWLCLFSVEFNRNVCVLDLAAANWLQCF